MDEIRCRKQLSFPVSICGELLSPGGPVCPYQACRHLLSRCPEMQYPRSACPSLMCFGDGQGVDVLNWRRSRKRKVMSLSRRPQPLGAAARPRQNAQCALAGTRRLFPSSACGRHRWTGASLFKALKRATAMALGNIDTWNRSSASGLQWHGKAAGPNQGLRGLRAVPFLTGCCEDERGHWD